MPDYIMRWLGSRFIDDLDELEDLGILTPEVRARKEAQLAMFTDDTATPAQAGRARRQRQRRAEAGRGGAHRHPPVVPAKLSLGGDLGPATRRAAG
jgi:hypothetical protein